MAVTAGAAAAVVAASLLLLLLLPLLFFSPPFVEAILDAFSFFLEEAEGLDALFEAVLPVEDDTTLEESPLEVVVVDELFVFSSLADV